MTMDPHFQMTYENTDVNSESEARAVARVTDEGFIIETGLGIAPGSKLYLAPQYAQAIETAAIMKCADLMVKRGVLSPDGLNYEALLALIPQDGRTQLASFTERAVAAGMNASSDFYYGKSEEVSSSDIAERLVTNLIGAAK